MAKNKPTPPPPQSVVANDPIDDILNDAIDHDEPTTESVDTIEDESQDEVTLLRREVARLKAERDELLAASATPDLDSLPLTRWVITLTDAPTWCVEARHPGEAWDEYRKQVGLINTPHQPSIVQASETHPLGRVKRG